jgi:hypothetical protein
VKISKCTFDGISGQNDGIVIELNNGAGQSEILESTFKNIKGKPEIFAVYISAQVLLDDVRFEDFGPSIAGIHTVNGGATLSSVSATGFELEGQSGSAYVIWVQPNYQGPVTLTGLSIANSHVGGLIWSESGDAPVLAGLTALNTLFNHQVVRNAANRADIFSAKFTNATFVSESQAEDPILFHGCHFEGGGNNDAVGILQENSANVFIIDSTFESLLYGIWSEHLQGGRGAEICNSVFKNVKTCIDIQVGAQVYISGTSFVGYTVRGIRIDSQETVSAALQVFVLETSYFKPGAGGEGKAIELRVTTVQPGSTIQTIKSTGFDSTVAEVTVVVVGGGQYNRSPLVVDSTVTFSGDPASLVVFSPPLSGNADDITPSQASPVTGAVKVAECPAALFGTPRPAPAVPTLVPDPPTVDAPTAPSSAVQTAASSAVQTEAQSATQSEASTAVQTEAQTVPQSASQSEASTAVQTEAQSATQSEASTAVQTEAQTVPQSASQSEASTAIQTAGQSAAQTPKSSPIGTAAQSPTPVSPSQSELVVSPRDNDSGLGNNADGGSPVGAAVGGAIAGVAAIVAGVVAFFLIKKRREKRMDEGVDEDADVGDPAELTSTVDLGEDHVFVSEYGLSDNRSPDEGGGDGGDGDESIGNDEE